MTRRASRCRRLATVRFADHTKWALLPAVLVPAALARRRPFLERLRRRGIPA